MKKFLSVIPMSGKNYDSVLPFEHSEEMFQKSWLSGGMPGSFAETHKEVLSKFFTDAKAGEHLTLLSNGPIRSAVIVRTK